MLGDGKGGGKKAREFWHLDRGEWMIGRKPAMRRSINLFQEFFKTEAAGGALLFVCACAGLVAANSGWAEVYRSLLATPANIAVGGFAVSLTVHQWINDGLMAVFFLLVGLEIKREALAGELASPRQAALPVAGALGGMVIPTLIYLASAGGGAAARGWAVPMATDIAFALGALAVAAPRAPHGLKVFLAALAIVDDIGAVLVIALFYSGEIAWGALGMAGLLLGILIVLNLLRVRSLAPYLTVGIALWFFVHASGVHATIAGVALALAIPTRTRINAPEFSAVARELLNEFDRTETGDFLVLTSKGQQEAIAGLERASGLVTAPLMRLERALHGFTAFFVMPLFAFSNAGVALAGSSVDRVTVAVALGLAVGKPVGITMAALATVKSGLASLPQGASWRTLGGCAALGGIGFTMSLFIASLAFEGTALLDAAKLGILGGSLLAGLTGAALARADRSGSADRPLRTLPDPERGPGSRP
jgi:NhaA family Na+:H+ antiporter